MVKLYLSTKLKEVESAKSKMEEAEEIKDIVKINLPIRRRDRILILSVDSSIEETVVKREVESQLAESKLDGSYTGLTDRLDTTDIDAGTRSIIENLIKKPGREVRIIRKIPTKQGKNNWLLDVDTESKKFLLDKRRVCLDFERYRVVEFISIMRCFRCQKFGFLANRCEEEAHCTICAENHHIRDCKNEKISSANCYFEDNEAECNHRADSLSCPAFIKYRESLLPRRS